WRFFSREPVLTLGSSPRAYFARQSRWRSGSPSTALLVRQPVGQGRRFFVRLLGFCPRLLGHRRALWFGGFARKPQRLQPRHVVEHGFTGGVPVGLAGSGVLGCSCGLVGTRLGAITILFGHFRS